jgi:hypothetical protein
MEELSPAAEFALRSLCEDPEAKTPEEITSRDRVQQFNTAAIRGGLLELERLGLAGERLGRWVLTPDGRETLSLGPLAVGSPVPTCDVKRRSWLCPTGEWPPASRWVKAGRLNPLIPRQSKRWKSLTEAAQPSSASSAGSRTSGRSGPSAYAAWSASRFTPI